MVVPFISISHNTKSCVFLKGSTGNVVLYYKYLSRQEWKKISLRNFYNPTGTSKKARNGQLLDWDCV